jgi:uncharacterized protein involved in exopolysaccharide biosynthesis
MENYFSNKNLLDLVWKWKIHLIIIGIIAGIVSIIFSSPNFIKPKYKSTAVVYPVNLSEYSEESSTEQMLEILNSGDIRDQIIEEFELDKHYKIDKNYKYYFTAMLGKYADNVSFRKTENEAIKIEVLDTDPQVACDMVNSLVALYNVKIADLHNIKYQELYEVYTDQLEKGYERLDSLSAIINKYGTDFGILEFYGDQTAEASRALFRSNTVKRQEAEKLLNHLADKGYEYKKMKDQFDGILKALVEIEVQRDATKAEIDKEITYSQVVTPPFPADKKTSPKRSLIVLMSVILTLILAIIIIGVIENRTYSSSRKTDTE